MVSLTSDKLIQKSIDEGVPKKEPAHDDEEANLQRALELRKGKREEEEVPVIKAGDQDEGQVGPNPGKQDEVQAVYNDPKLF
ncbi:hypothetical protein Tco_0589268 [Tanacetum coccineum]